MLFKPEINSWEDWSRVFQDINVFKPLIIEVFSRYGLTHNDITLMSPGTNANFRSGKYVIKFYPPQEAGISGNSNDDIIFEVNAILNASMAGIDAPKLLHWGKLEDKYIFSYMIYRYLDGKEASNVLPFLSEKEKLIIIENVKGLLNCLKNIKFVQKHFFDLKNRAMTNFRWNIFNRDFNASAKHIISKIPMEDMVFCHGDLTAENVLVQKDLSLSLIDFGDFCIAPSYYEYPPVIFDLFGFDGFYIREFFRGKSSHTVIDTLINAILLHDFGGDILRSICVEKLSIRPENLKSINEIRPFLGQLIKNDRV